MIQAGEIFEGDSLWLKSCIDLKDLLERNLELETLDGDIIQCILVSMDPVTRIILTGIYVDDTVKLTMHMYGEVKKISVGEKVTDNTILTALSDLNQRSSIIVTPEGRKEKVIKWLRDNLIEVIEEEHCLKVMNQVCIQEPYVKESCVAENTIVLDRIRSILDRMPED